jgi:hypothetical protein
MQPSLYFYFSISSERFLQQIPVLQVCLAMESIQKMWKGQQASRFVPLNSDSPEEALLASSQEDNEENEKYSTVSELLQRRNRVAVSCAVLIGLLVLNMYLTIRYMMAMPSDQQCTRQLSIWCKWTKSAISAYTLLTAAAPLNEIVEYQEVDFVNPFAHQTPYRGPPTPELEDAWAHLWFCESTSEVTI